ncbi:MAG: hypothetical protein NT126_11605, partial [Bacteroidetes bacterium]|nr:hypothetical protein [Bacteroidota bacterium]
MKQFKLLCVVLLFISICPEKIKAQSSLAIPYQAVARDQFGNAISNHAISVRFSILDSSSTGPIIYSETDMVTTNEFGLFTVEIGRAIATTTGIFDPTKWKVLSSFVKTEMDTSGGSNFTDMGTSQIFCVPFAAYAETAGFVAGAATKQYVDAADALKADKVIGTTLNDIAILDASGNLVDGGKKLSDYLTKDNSSSYTPTGDYNPATKKYVDDHASLSIVPNGTAIGQTLHWDGAAWVADSGIYSNGKRFGIGVTTPASPLGIKGEDGGDDQMISFFSSDNSQKWN